MIETAAKQQPKQQHNSDPRLGWNIVFFSLLDSSLPHF